MTDEATRRLLERLEEEARAHPGRYRARILCYAALGYLWLSVALVLTLLVICMMILFARPLLSGSTDEIPFMYIGAIIGLVFFLGAQLGTLFVEPPLIGYQELEQKSFPQLHQVIDDVQQGMGVRCALQVYLTPHFNASIAEASGGVRSLFSRARARLFLGAPLLLCLTEPELRVVLAHELAHFQNKHCRFGAWVHRLFQRMERGVQSNYSGANPFKKLGQRYLKWYAPFFAMRTLPIRRIHEYESDAAAARSEGVEETARTLTRIVWAADQFDRHFQPSLLRLAAAGEVPPQDFLERATVFFESPSEPGAFEHWKESEISARSWIDEEHPSLIERLEGIGAGKAYFEALNQAPQPATPETRSFALLESESGALIHQVNQLWRCAIMDEWRERRAYHSYLTAQIAAAKEKPEEAAETEPENDFEWLLLDLDLQGLGKMRAWNA